MIHKTVDAEVVKFARQVIQIEAEAVRAMEGAIDDAFERACRLILDCPDAVLATGIGKAGHVARKVSATLASTGTPSHFLSPADAVHGDLGAIRKGDVILIFSASGESDEILRLLNIVKKLDHTVIAITATKTSGLGRFADVVLTMGKIEEACPLGLAPSASTTAMLALGDALALSVMKLRKFSPDDFALFHPAGQLGRKLLRVREAMTFKPSSLARISLLRPNERRSAMCCMMSARSNDAAARSSSSTTPVSSAESSPTETSAGS
jgi:arabinose-5-phosphate isomerase